MTINNRAFANALKKQLNIHYSIPARDITYFTVDSLSETIEFTQGNHEIISDYIHSNFGHNKDINKARAIATNLLQHY